MLCGKRCDAMRNRVANRPTIAERAIEPDREGTRGIVTCHVTYSNHTIDLGAERSRTSGTVAGIQHQRTDAACCGAEHARKSASADRLRPAVFILEDQVLAVVGGPAEMDYGRVEFR